MPMSIGPGADFWQALGWHPEPEQLNQLNQLQTLLRDWNGRVNLTRLVEGDDFWINQVFDSLWPLQDLLQTDKTARRCIDVGTGGGFPGLAIAIALPGAKMTLLDSVGRKTAAVQAMAKGLGLTSRVSVRTERIEATGQDPRSRQGFDLAVARAVAAAPVVAEYLVPLLSPNGEALLYRGQWSGNDDRELNQALKQLRAEVIDVQTTQLPAQRGIRHVLRVKSCGPCPAAYPRAIGIPSKFPLHEAGR